MKTSGIEHRLYSIERSVEQKLLLCPPKYATMLALEGWVVFDFNKSLDLEPEYYTKETVYEYSSQSTI